MTKISKKILFFGTEDFSAIALQGLIAAEFSIAAVITKPDTLRGRHQTLTKPAVKLLAEQHGIPVWQPQTLHEIRDDIIALAPIAGVLVSYGKIIPQSILELFTPGIINLHPSLLPTYRGPSPIESAILNQDSETGVSIMQLSARMDAGPVYRQVSYPLDSNETKQTLYKKLGDLGTKTLLRTLPAILDGTLLPVPQNDEVASYCSLLSKSDAFLDPSKLTAAEADAHVRAYQGFPGSRTQLSSTEVILTQAHISSRTSELSLKCKDGNYLVIDQLKPIGKKEMPVTAFLTGYKA